MTMPAIAPEDRPEEVLDALWLVDGLNTDTDEDVATSALD